MIPGDFIQSLLNRVDIVELIDRYVPLKKVGANYQACCPFHQEKTPSFTVSQSKQFYYCFGCGAHGNAIGFLIEHRGESFIDAVHELAEQIGLAVPNVTNQSVPQFDRSAEHLLTAAQFYKTQLKSAPTAIAYLKKRGLSGEIAAQFGIGYAPAGWQALASAFPNYDDPALEAVGLVISGEQGRRYDRFRDRIMFPITDNRGLVIGFGGRVLDDSEPKYLNSPETALFSKGRELYGLEQARPAIRSHDRVVVVEGYMDVVALAQHGVGYAVATLGTATTSTHVQKLFRLAQHIYYCFDGDQAGKKAAWRALENTLEVMVDNKKVSFLFLPQDEDPDSFIRTQGQTAFEGLLEQSVALSDFLIDELINRFPGSGSENRAALLNAAKAYFTKLNAPILRKLLVRKLGQLSELSEQELAEILPAAENKSLRRAKILPRRPASLTDKLIGAILLQPLLAQQIKLPPPRNLPDQTSLAALVELIGSYSGDTLSAVGLIEHFRGSPHDSLLNRIYAHLQASGSEDLVLAEFGAAVEKYENLRLEDQVNELFQKKQRGEAWSEEEHAQYQRWAKRLA